MTEGAGARTNGIRVLIVDDEVNLRFATERRLRKAGMVTASASTARHAIDRLRNEPYDVVLCDLRMPGGSGEELLRWLGSYSPSTRAIVISAYITEDFKKTFRPGDNLRHMEKPVDLDGLVEQIEAIGPRKGFYGNSIEVELFDYVQMIALTGRDKLIEVITPKGTGFIWFEHGDIVHVEYGEYRGEMAFYHVLSVNRGTFQEAFWRDPPKQTVHRSSTHLLMEAARMADEGTLQQLEQDEPEPELVEKPLTESGAVAAEVEDETSFESLNNDSGASFEEPLDDVEVEDSVAELVESDVEPAASETSSTMPKPKPRVAPPPPPKAPAPAAVAANSSAANTAGAGEASAGASVPGHAIFEDPDTRQVMLEQFWQFDGINGVAIISSTGKVLAEDMRSNSSMVTLAGFYMRGAARLARTLGYNVFDGVVARSMNGQQMVMVSMGAASAVLSVDAGNDPEVVRDAVMGVE
ncbi:MAG: response regulator [Myxococcota bacterium]